MPERVSSPTTARIVRVQTFSRFLIAFLAVVFVFTAIPTVDVSAAVTQDQINSLKKKQSDIGTNKRSLQDKISAIQNDKAQAVKRKALLEEQIEVIRQELDVTNNLIAQLDQQITEKTAELEAARAEEARYYDKFCERVRAMEEGGTVSYWAVLFHSSDFSDLLDQLTRISEIMDYDNNVMDDLADARVAVANAKEQLETARLEQQDAKTQLEASQSQLKQQQSAVATLVAEISAQEEEYQDQLHEMEQNVVDLSKEISAAEKQYAAQIAAARQQAQSGSLVGTGGFIWPLPSGNTRVNSPYGWRICPFHGQEFHSGIDVPAPSGTNIYASKTGTVVISTYHSSYGNYVVIAHTDGSKSLYAHMKARVASAGSTVTQGEKIGYVGTTGTSTGNHLHFEIWTGSTSSTRTNPMNYF